jgi:uncharacterized protein with von Willebrand factor type A (vWA) domain
MAVRSEADTLIFNLAAFGRVLRSEGLEVGPQRLQTAIRGLDATGLTTRETVYWTLFCSLVSRRQDAAAFDVAFSAFWDRLFPAVTEDTESPAPQRSAATEPDEAPASPTAVASPSGTPGDDADADDSDALDEGSSWSADEQLRSVDFSTYGQDELLAAAGYLEAIARLAPRRRSRRFRPATSGRAMDRRRTLRTAMRTEGHPLERCWREQRIVPRRLVFLIDVSGSMEAYARPLLLFAQTVSRATRKVEVFTFGTRLTRITAELTGRDASRALRRAGQAIPDWAGGTRIGDNLKTFNDTAGRRGMTRGAVVVVVSDGCERGDAQMLGEQMARLHRSTYTVVWVNPLAGDPRYAPRTQGMVAALPSIDALLPGHNLAALESLAEILEAIPDRRRTGG